MPVLITAAAVSRLMKTSGDNRGSFLYPASILSRLEKLPESDRRERALGIMNDLERLGQRYVKSAKASLEAYAKEAERHSSSADSLIALRRPQDAAFARLVDDVIRIRQSLLDTLSRQEWDQVLG